MLNKEFKEKYDNKIKKRDKIVKKTVDIKWIAQISTLAFVISIAFSGGASKILDSVNIFWGLVIVLIVVTIGVLFDMIGISATSADQKPFHSMASKQVKGSKFAIKLIKNAEKVSVFCNDVVGDICNILSGSAGAVIAVSISEKYHVDLILISLLVTAVVASITVGGKAIGRSYAINKSEVIIYKFSQLMTALTGNKN